MQAEPPYSISYDLTAEQMGDWAAAMGIEAVYIDKDTNIRDFKNELRWNELAFRNNNFVINTEAAISG